MKKFNVVCMAALLACGTHCTSNLHAESTDLTEHHNEILDNEVDTIEETNNNEVETINFNDESHVTDETDITRSDIDEDVIDDVQEVTIEVSTINQANINEAIVVTTAVTQEAIAEDNLDTMVDELIQSGVTEENLSTLETQPQWKLLLARVGSYALSMGISCKELLTTIFTNVQTTLQNYWSNNKKA